MKKALTILSLILLHSSLMAAAPGAPAAPFQNWTMAETKMRSLEQNFVKKDGAGVTFTGDRKSAYYYFSPAAISVVPGDVVKISFDISGTGSGVLGFFFYKEQGWHQLGTKYQLFQAGAAPRTVTREFVIDHQGTGCIRPILQILQNASFTITNYRLDLRKKQVD